MDAPAPPLESPSTGPKPFIFVLMPFEEKFTDAYQLGIKEAAKEVGAYAERVDEQMYSEGILERIFNQIAKADVVVADMTGRNENVFYEVGYAHALNKVVVLLTQDADDIPFDLKHRPHLVYEGKVTKIRTELPRWLTWAVGESWRRRQPAVDTRLSLSWDGVDIPEVTLGSSVPEFEYEVGSSGRAIDVVMQVTNYGAVESDPISHVYLFCQDRVVAAAGFWIERTIQVRAGTRLTRRPERIVSDLCALPAMHSSDADMARLRLPWHFRLKQGIPAIPAGASEVLEYGIAVAAGIGPLSMVLECCLRLRVGGRQLDFPFALVLSELGSALKEGGRRMVEEE